MARRAEISFEGLNLSRTITALSQKFTLQNVVRQGRSCKITVDLKDLRKVVAFLKERCYNITDIKKLGWNFVFSFAKTHFLLPVFLILAVAVFFISSEFCWKIEVSGDFPASEVLQALEESDVSVGNSLFGFSADVLENKLCSELDAMYAVVTRKGSVLYVNAVKRKTADKAVDMHTRRDIFATSSGKITQLLCEQGTAAVQVGDYVEKGVLLIEGRRIFSDGTSEDVYALGKVKLELSVEGFAEFLGTTTVVEDTGKTFCANAVVFFGKSYGKQPSFETFREESFETSLSPLNLTIKRITYYETIRTTRTATLEECLDELKLQALQNALQQADFVVTKVEYRVTANGVFATAYGEVEIT